MPTFYNFRENGLDYSFDDVFIPADLFRQGNLWTWGSGRYGALGNGQTLDRPTPLTTFAGGTNWKQVGGSSRSLAAIKTDGTLWTWGYNGSGQLGINNTIDRSTPVTVFGGGTNWKQIGGSAAAIKTDGTLWIWGGNDNGQLGINNTITKSTPVTTFVGGTNWKQVVTTIYQSAYALKTDGTLWVWGRNDNGQLGTNDTITKSTPVTTFVGGTNWKQVDARSNLSTGHAAGIKTDGTLWVWGSNSSQKLGINATGNRSIPVTVFGGGTNWKQVACGGYSTGAIKIDGTLWTWGNGSGLGINATGDRSTPVTTFAGGNNWKTISAGLRHFASIKGDGTLWTWGVATSNGELGNNLFSSALTPVTTFAGGTNWKQVYAGFLLTSAVTYEDPVI